MYTVKRLESGGFEVEFPCAEYLPMIRDQLDKRYPTIRWHDSAACKQEATLKVPRPGVSQSTGRHRARTPGCQLLLVQLGNPVLGERRLWVTDVKQSSLGQQHAGAWIDTELCVIYRSVERMLCSTVLSSTALYSCILHDSRHPLLTQPFLTALYCTALCCTILHLILHHLYVSADTPLLTVMCCIILYCLLLHHAVVLTELLSIIRNCVVLYCTVLFCVLYSTSPNSASSTARRISLCNNNRCPLQVPPPPKYDVTDYVSHRTTVLPPGF